MLKSHMQTALAEAQMRTQINAFDFFLMTSHSGVNKVKQASSLICPWYHGHT